MCVFPNFSGTRKRRNEGPDGAGGKMFIKTEDGEMVEVTKLDEEDDTLIDLTVEDEDNENSNDNNNAETGAVTEVNDNQNKTAENKQSSSTSETKQSDASQNNSTGEQLDIKPDKTALDKKIKEAEKQITHKGSQTVPVVVKLATLEESQLLKLKPVEKNTMLLSKTRELAEASENLKSLQENIYRLLKIIVPDYDYGEPENVEKVILEFIRVNEEESQEASGSQ